MENIANIITSGILSILGALASYAVAVGINYIKNKRDALIKQIGADQYNANYEIAKNIYYAVEQQFKFIPDAGKQKASEFNKKLLEKIPGITQEDIDHFREAICGKINSEIKDSNILAPAYNEKKDEADVKVTQ